jgi:hypothetical protein
MSPKLTANLKSRTFIVSLATAATIGVASFTAIPAEARTFGGSFAGGGGHAHTYVPASVRLPGGPGNPGGNHPGLPGGHPPIWHPHPHWHGHWFGHWVFRDGVWVVGDDVPVAPGPCTCLTKTYTPTGLVVFADVCTREAASARVDGAADASPVPPDSSQTPKGSSLPPSGPAVSEAPTSPNYAGRTYQDFLAANVQASEQAPAKN